MDRATSIYLDLVRFSMASVVFLSHIAKQKYSGGLLWQMTSYGEDAVDVFFVLSGFIISHVTADREKTFCDYFANRAARVCSVAIPALLLTIGLDAIGERLAPSAYDSGIPGHPEATPWVIVSNSLLFCNQIWFNFQSMGANAPFWSLTFEVWYYVIFGVVVFTRRPLGYVIACLVLLFIGPKIAILFPLWLLGTACYRLSQRLTLNVRSGLILTLLPIIVFAVCKKAGMPESAPNSQLQLNLTYFAQFAADYITAACFAAHLLGINAIAPKMGQALTPIEPAIRWLSGRTFSFYLFHFPILNAIAVVLPWPHSSFLTRASVLILPPVIVLFLAEVTERRKSEWRRGFAAVSHLRTLIPSRRSSSE